MDDTTDRSVDMARHDARRQCRGRRCCAMIFGAEMTAVPSQCAHCGNVAEVGTTHAWMEGPGHRAALLDLPRSGDPHRRDARRPLSSTRAGRPTCASRARFTAGGAGDVRAAACPQGCPPRIHRRRISWTVGGAIGRSSWITALTGAGGRFLSFGLPEGATRDRRTEITSRLIVPRVGRFGRFVAHSRVGSARRDVIGIPVSILSPRRAKQRRSSAAGPRARGVGVFPAFAPGRHVVASVDPVALHPAVGVPGPPGCARGRRPRANGHRAPRRAGAGVGPRAALPTRRASRRRSRSRTCPAGRRRRHRAMPAACSSAPRRVPVVMLQGRLHLYEGNAPGLVVQPVLLMGRLGARPSC